MSESSHVTPPRVAVVGLGAWGSALALYCSRIGCSVIGWHRDQNHIASIRSTKRLRVNKTCEHPLPDTLNLTSSIEDIRNNDLVLVALPASAWAEVLPKVAPQGVLVSATKGIEKNTHATPLSWAQKQLAVSPKDLCVISGPSFASDVANGTPITMVAASQNMDTARKVAASLSSNTLRLYPSSDPLGVELGGILKNVISIAAGISDALSYGPSTRAALITRGLAEMTRVAVALGAKAQTLSGLSGLGDLVMTATDDQSRNRIVGLRLGKGEKLQDILDTLGSTAEGVSSAGLVETIAQKHGIDIPIIKLVGATLRGEIAPKDLAKTLMSRPLREEF